MNAVIYARYSSDKQTEQSIEGQLRDCRAYADRCGYTVVGEYIDRAQSGRYADRPDFQRMIADARKRGFAYIIVWKLDRFARSRYDSAVYKHRLKQDGVKVVSAMEGVSDAPEGVILEATLEAMAEYYSTNLAQNVRRGMRESAKKGNSTGGTIPLGYRLENKRLVIDEKTAPAVRFIFQAYAAGEGKRAIADELNRRGFRTRSGTPFTVNSFGALLKNEKYVGTYHYADSAEGVIRIDNACPPLVDQETFDACQKVATANRRAPGRHKAKIAYLLQGKLFCGLCGAPMVGDSGTGCGGATYHYYSCRTARQQKTCRKKREKKDFVEWLVVEQAAQYVLQPARLAYIAERVVEVYNADDRSGQISEIQRRLVEIDRDRDRIVDRLLATDSPGVLEKLRERAGLLDARQGELEAELSRLRIEAKARLTVDEVKAWLVRFCQGDPQDTDFRARIIDTLINAVYFFDDKVVVYFNVRDGAQVTFIEMQQDVESSDSGPDGSPHNSTSERYLFRRGVFGCVVNREPL